MTMDDKETAGAERLAPRMASLLDVSKHAGVSIATASRVLNGSPHPVSAATREKVMAAASEMNYSPSVLAQALVKNQSKIIGVIVQDSTDPYFAEITRGIEEYANAEGYLTIICNADRKTELEIAQLRLLRDYKAAGIVFAASGWVGGDGEELTRLVDTVQAEGVCVVALGGREFESSVITFDNSAASYDLTQHLIVSGCKRISFVSGLDRVYAAEQRLDGYTRAMENAGLTPHIVQGNFASESGSSAAVRLLADGPLPDAIIGSNDQTAAGVMTSLRNAGIDVPGDVRVAGIGSTSLARLLDMTTVGIHLRTFGGFVARKILDANSAEITMTVIPHSVERRSSTADGSGRWRSR